MVTYGKQIYEAVFNFNKLIAFQGDKSHTVSEAPAHTSGKMASLNIVRQNVILTLYRKRTENHFHLSIDLSFLRNYLLTSCLQ